MPLPLHFLDRSELAYAIDPAAPPRLTVIPPCEVMIETHNSRSGKLKRPEDEEPTRPTFADRFPRTNPATVDLKRDRIDYWTRNGAQISDRVSKLLAKAPAVEAAPAA